MLINPTQKLDVDGLIRIRGGGPGLGKILTSSADGSATWETPIRQGFIIGRNAVGTEYTSFTINLNGDAAQSSLSLAGKKNEANPALTKDTFNIINENNKLTTYVFGNKLTTLVNNENFGIGTENPNFKLDVNGKINAADGIDFPRVPEVGIRFYNNDAYKISMGNSASYHYGPVTSDSIKSNMDMYNDGARGWTWGSIDKKSIAALNVKGEMRIESSLSVGWPLVNGTALTINGRTYIS